MFAQIIHNSQVDGTENEGGNDYHAVIERSTDGEGFYLFGDSLEACAKELAAWEEDLLDDGVTLYRSEWPVATIYKDGSYSSH